MEHRQLGRTGVSVSEFCRGTMMFAAWGNPDQDESIRIIHAALGRTSASSMPSSSSPSSPTTRWSQRRAGANRRHSEWSLSRVSRPRP
jgi:hypothetical protein